MKYSIYAFIAVAAGALIWFMAAAPRIKLAELNHSIAAAKVVELEHLDNERVELIQHQQLQILEITENEKRNRELLQTIAGQSRAQSRALEELKRNDETISEYLRTAVPADLGRLYQRAATTDPSAYRQSSSLPTDVLRPASATGAANK